MVRFLKALSSQASVGFCKAGLINTISVRKIETPSSICHAQTQWYQVSKFSNLFESLRDELCICNRWRDYR